MLKHLLNILPQPTSHGVGQKRVLLSQAETDTNLTHYPTRRRNDGRTLAPTMENCFFFLSGGTISNIKNE